jgi:hypothetical protein
MGAHRNSQGNIVRSLAILMRLAGQKPCEYSSKMISLGNSQKGKSNQSKCRQQDSTAYSAFGYLTTEPN